jgi:putative flippase GtrA
VGERWHHLLTEIGRFMAVGGLATFVSILVFNFLVHGLYITSDPWLSGHPITAFVVASFVGMVISYRLSRSWTFRHRPPQAADGGRLAYFVINTATMIIPIACLWLSRNVLGLDDPYSDNLAGNIIGALLGQAARFYLFRTYVFQKPEGGYHLSDYLQLDNADDTQVTPQDDQSTGQSTSGRVPPSAP